MAFESDPSRPEKPVVLIVDDQPIIIHSVTAFLDEIDYKVISALNGQKGIEQAEAFKPDLIITDLQMPVMDGYAMIRELRTMREFFFTPIIIMTSLAESEDRQMGFQFGADDFINKEHMHAEIGFRASKALSAARLKKRCAVLEMKLVNLTDVGFSGSLSEFRLASLMTVGRLESLSCQLELTHANGEKGEIYLHEGEVVSAQLTGQQKEKNEKAFSRMLGWTSGTFTLHKKEPSGLPRDRMNATDGLSRTATDQANEAGRALPLKTFHPVADQ